MSIKIFIEYEGSPVRYFPIIKDGEINITADDLGLDQDEFDLSKVIFGLDCKNMNQNEIEQAYIELQKCLGGEICY